MTGGPAAPCRWQRAETDRTDGSRFCRGALGAVVPGVAGGCRGTEAGTYASAESDPTCCVDASADALGMH